MPFWGRGYIPEAVKALIARCFSEGAARVWCAHFEGNEKSRRVIEKCGFRYRFSEPWTREGREIQPETLFYSLAREELQK